MITASHNPANYNGIKLFNGSEGKFSLAEEQSLQQTLQKFNAKPLPKGSTYATYDQHHERAKAVYLKHLIHSFQRFSGTQKLTNTQAKAVKIVVDCAHGANYEVAPLLLQQLGAELVCIGTKPDGNNINDACGSTHHELIQQQVVRECADLAIAFDGDGDRLLMADHTGDLVDGDYLLMLLADEFADRDKGVVGTLMTNLFVEQYLQTKNIAFVRAQVGDKFVSAELDKRNWLVGSEPSGHIFVARN